MEISVKAFTINCLIIGLTFDRHSREGGNPIS